LGATLRMRSDAFSLVGGVRALVVDESEGELLLTYRNSLPEHTIVHVHGVNPQQNARGNTFSKVLYVVTVDGRYTLEGTDFPKKIVRGGRVSALQVLAHCSWRVQACAIRPPADGHLFPPRASLHADGSRQHILISPLYSKFIQ
jgi:hypothetical protein